MFPSIVTGSRVLPFIAGSAVVCAITLLAHQVLGKMPYLSDGKRAMVGSVAVTILAASTCTSMSWIAITVGAVASLIILGRRRAALVARAAPDRQGVFLFIADAVRGGRADRLRQLTRFLSQLPQFQDRAKQTGLAVYLQEEILKKILAANRVDLLDQIFLCPISRALLANIPSISGDVANVISEYVGELIDEQGYFRVLRMTDGTLCSQLREHPDVRMQHFGRDIGLAMAEGGAGVGDYISIALRNVPVFEGIDLTPLLAR